ncbi:alanine/glycine:cation symporter family protein [Oribacterium sp.]
MSVLQDFIGKGNTFLWSFLLIFLLCGTGIYYTIRLRFIQLRRLGEGFKLVFGHFSLKGEKHEKGEMSPFQAIATAIAAQVGTGNLAGAATAIVSGGPGAIFWMWVSAFFGMATIYGEAVLAQVYKEEKDGDVTGGPVYYIKAAFSGALGKVLAGLFAVFIILALGFMGNMVQSNSIGAAFQEAFHIMNLEVPTMAIGVFVAAIAAFIFLGGTKRLAAVLEKIVPIMAGVYIVGAVIFILMHITALPGALASIFIGAFNPQAVTGAALGITIRQAIRFGVARGLFSNEAGMGSTPHAHARAKAKCPDDQGLCAMVSVFIDTFVVLNFTVFVILTSGIYGQLDPATQKPLYTGIALTQRAFVAGFGNFGHFFVAICLFFFAFSTVLGWHFFGAVNVQYLFGKKAVTLYSLIVVACIIVGTTLKVEFVWDLADFFNGLMVIPNVLALLALFRVVKEHVKK